MGVIDSYEGISLDGMSAISLMNRVDTKYVATEDRLEDILSACRDSFSVLEAGGCRIAPYDTLYFDTPGRDMYLMHHAGRLSRRKVRTRTYLSSGSTFLEIKLKNNHGRTKKKRMEIGRQMFSRPSEADGAEVFLGKHTLYSFPDLSPALGTSFDRITLASKAMNERVTIDMHLKFHNWRNGSDSDLGHLVIIEVKQDGHCMSRMGEILREMRIHPLRISKYCIGTALSDPSAKQNRFKPKIHHLNKLMNSTIC